MPKRSCAAINQGREPCRQPPLRDGEFCFWHDPEHAQAAADARRLGGQRRKREGALSGAYEFSGLEGPQDLKRILEIAAYDALALDNSVARVRTLIALVQAGARLFEITELEDRLRALEAAMEPRLRTVGGGRR
jgi:hypothetical protein